MSLYFDYNATAPLRPEALEAMLPYLRERYGNPSSLHRIGQEARKALERAREQVAALLGASDPSEIVFTSGGSESDNFAVKGLAFAHGDKGRHLVVSAIEHHAVLESVRYLETQHGFQVATVPVESSGVVSPEAVGQAIRPDTLLVSVMTANNEVGTVQPVDEIGRLCRERGVAFHTDAVQAAGKLPLSVKDRPLDMASISAHKFGGPKGVGALYVKRGVRLHAWIHGGRHERNRRAGTENVAGAVGMGEAASLALRELPAESARLAALRDNFEREILRRIPRVRVNGDPARRLSNTSNLCFEGTEGEALVIALDLAGLAASVGSACTTGSVEPSHVLAAMGLSRELAHACLRFSFGHDTAPADIGKALDIIPPAVERARAASPLGKTEAALRKSAIK